MFKRSYNRLLLHLEIHTISPLLIKAGDGAMTPTSAQLACVRTRHATAGTTVYIPGSSLRGVIRSAAEASLYGRRFQGKHNPVEGADDPLASRGALDSERPTAEVFRGHALTARLFGSPHLKSRCSIRDLFPWRGESPGKEATDLESAQRANKTELRHNVHIDRFLGSVKHGPWDSDLVPAGVSFWGDIALENYELWQLGLLAQAIEELNDGFAQLGSGKSRGLGLVRATVLGLLHEQPARAGESPLGVHDLVDKETRQAYDLLGDRGAQLPMVTADRRGLHHRFAAKTVETAQPWLEAGLQALQGLREITQ